MRIGEAAKRTGLTDSNIRFYEKKGLLTPARKAESGYRDYTEEDVYRLKLIVLYRKMDFSIEKIEALLGGRLTMAEACRQQEEELAARVEALEGAMELCRMLGQTTLSGEDIQMSGQETVRGEDIRMPGQEMVLSEADLDYYLNYVREAEDAGRRFAGAEEWLDDMAAYSSGNIHNISFYYMLVMHPRLAKVLSVLVFLLIIFLPLIILLENYFDGGETGLPGGYLLFWSIILLTYVGGFLRYRAHKNRHRNDCV